MAVSKKSQRPRLKREAGTQAHLPSSRWARAFYDQKLILLTGALYIAVIIAESLYAGVPVSQFLRVFLILPLIVVKCVLLLLGLSVGVLLCGLFLPEARKKKMLQRWRHGWSHMDDLATRYLNGDVFAYGCLGVLVMVANGFYFIQKCLIHVLHPFAWDDAFVSADRFLHFGHSPDEFVVAITQMFHLGHVFDVAYFLWFVVMYLSLGFTLFWDNDLKRRLRFLWCFLLSWILLGSVLGTWFSAAGPLFYHNFFPHKPDPYADFVRYIDDFGHKDFPIAYWSGKHLLEWTTNGEIVNFNAVAAFPSMHIAIAWLATLYGFSISRKLGYAGAAFCVLIYFATVLFGFHYALDSYVSLICVSLMWWAAGKLLDRRHPKDVILTRA